MWGGRGRTTRECLQASGQTFAEAMSWSVPSTTTCLTFASRLEIPGTCQTVSRSFHREVGDEAFTGEVPKEVPEARVGPSRERDDPARGARSRKGKSTERRRARDGPSLQEMRFDAVYFSGSFSVPEPDVGG